MWLILRGRGFKFYYDDLIIEFTERTGRVDRTVRRWINAGEGIFWNYGSDRNGKKVVSIIGKQRVIEYFELPIPGRVVLIDEDKLLGRLQLLRATLSTTWMNGKEKQFCSRALITKITGKTHQTQINYEKHTGQKKLFIQTNQMKSEYGGDYKQFPNIYYAVNYPEHYRPKKHIYRYDFYPVENQKRENVAGKMKILYESVERADKAIAENRSNFALGIIKYKSNLALVNVMTNI